MPHVKLLLDPAKFLNDSDFTADGREVTISRIVREKLPERKGEAEASAPMLYVVATGGGEYGRPMKVPKLVLYGLGIMLGTETNAWKGKKIWIYSTFCNAFGDREPCLRVKFPADVEVAVRKHIKKRKLNPLMYVLDEPKSKREPGSEG